MVPQIHSVQGLINSISKAKGIIFVKIWSKPSYRNKSTGAYVAAGDPFYMTVVVPEEHTDAKMILSIEVDEKGKPRSEKSPTLYVKGGCSFNVKNSVGKDGRNWTNLSARLNKESRVYVNGKPPAGEDKASDPEVAGRIPEEEDQF